MTDRAPSGVTKIAGAKVYAAKLATKHAILNILDPYFSVSAYIPSPTITEIATNKKR